MDRGHAACLCCREVVGQVCELSHHAVKSVIHTNQVLRLHGTLLGLIHPKGHVSIELPRASLVESHNPSGIVQGVGARSLTFDLLGAAEASSGA